MEFSEEQIKEIDEELKQAKELQLKNGNRLYTTEEVRQMAQKLIKEISTYLQS